MKKEVCFLTVATGKWEIFILPYIFNSLYFNKNSYVEILTRNDQDKDSLKVLNEIFGDSFKIKKLPKIEGKRNLPDCAIRFIVEPEIKSEYTYIGDVDIMILESNIVEVHKKIMKENNLCYSNIVRPNSTRLTGLHCVESEPYFEKTRKIRNSIICSSGSDEEMLFNIVNDSIADPLKNNNKLRPIHGFHFSLMRQPKVENKEKPSWYLGSVEHQNIYNELKKSNEWKAIYPFFNDKYKNILKTAEENF